MLGIAEYPEKATHKMCPCCARGDMATHKMCPCAARGDMATHKMCPCYARGDMATHKMCPCAARGDMATHKMCPCAARGDMATHKMCPCCVQGDMQSFLHNYRYPFGKLGWWFYCSCRRPWGVALAPSLASLWHFHTRPCAPPGNILYFLGGGDCRW